VKIGTTTINGVKFEIEVSPGTGMFRTELDGDTVESPTKAALIQRLNALMRDSVRVAISAVLVEHNELTTITLTGVHAGNGNLLYTRAGKKGAQQMYRYVGNEKVLRVLTDAERAEYKGLITVQRDAGKAINTWLKARRINAAETVRKALAKTATVTP